MKHYTIMRLSLALLNASCASAPVIEVPQALQPASNESLAMTVSARGVQIYECRARKDAGGYEWIFVAPEAVLFDGSGRPAGRHGAGPFWQAEDGSRTVGTVKARADAPVAGAIPWLLLTARNDGPAGSLSRITSIQRINTAGGVAPAGTCTPGTPARIDYTADYRFFTAR